MINSRRAAWYAYLRWRFPTDMFWSDSIESIAVLASRLQAFSCRCDTAAIWLFTNIFMAIVLLNFFFFSPYCRDNIDLSELPTSKLDTTVLLLNQLNLTDTSIAIFYFLTLLTCGTPLPFYFFLVTYNVPKFTCNVKHHLVSSLTPFHYCPFLSQVFSFFFTPWNPVSPRSIISMLG